jgi:hypothetical protein
MTAPSDPPPVATFLRITNPERGVAVLNVQAEGGELQRFRLSKDQLFGANKDCADILLGNFR